MDEERASKLFNLPEMFRSSHHAKKIVQTTQPIFEEFSTSFGTVGFKKENETEVTYATSFFSQVAFSEFNCWSIVTKLLLSLNSGSHLLSRFTGRVELICCKFYRPPRPINGPMKYILSPVTTDMPTKSLMPGAGCDTKCSHILEPVVFLAY